MNNFARAVIVSVALGASIPIVWSLLYYGVGGAFPEFKDGLLTASGSNTLRLLIWPTSILLLGDPDDSNYGLVLVSVAGNMLLYGLLGALIWMGLHRSKMYLIFPVLLTAGIWYWVLIL
ncbi:hypothetical protein [Pseudoxanthomonas sp. UTMC 1351]|uniref:hypothetical protein n=1 Tax=Pseudoxanthomonas sp. UTMC 1351 TaxID=2695853 RepID=UPI0034CF3A0B